MLFDMVTKNRPLASKTVKVGKKRITGMLGMGEGGGGGEADH